MEAGHELGLIDNETFKNMKERQKQIAGEIDRIRRAVLKPSSEVNEFLGARTSPLIDNGMHLDQLLKRSELDYELVKKFSPPEHELNARVLRQVEIEVKYEGYISKQLKEIEQFKTQEKLRIPVGFDFKTVHGLSNELKEKLSAVRPISLGQASRMDGMTPAALSVLMVALKSRHLKRETENSESIKI
jgi:tRNA uridine 5-carboxymethylaminomethyl modification enzyme